MIPTTGLRVFLSYPREEEARVTELYDWLRRSGHDPWLDTKHLVGGQAWSQEIRNALAESDMTDQLAAAAEADEIRQ